MILKTISYENYNGEKVKREFGFNWTIDEVAEWELSTEGGVETWMKDIIESRSNETVMAIFRKVVGSSIGERTADGEGFRKSKKMTRQFIGSRAYDAMLIEFLEDAQKFSDFFNDLLPAGITEIAAKAEENRKKAEEEGRIIYTDSDLLAMTDDAFFAAAGTKKANKMDRQFKTVAFMRRNKKRLDDGSVEKTAA